MSIQIHPPEHPAERRRRLASIHRAHPWPAPPRDPGSAATAGAHQTIVPETHHLENRTRRRHARGSDDFFLYDAGIQIIAAILITLMGLCAAFGCQETPGLGPNDPWVGSELPAPSTFRHVGPGTWTVSDGRGGITTLRPGNK